MIYKPFGFNFSFKRFLFLLENRKINENVKRNEPPRPKGRGIMQRK